MLTDSIDPNLLVALLIGGSGLLLFVCLDRYITRRHGLIANARYVERMQTAGCDFGGRSANSEKWNLQDAWRAGFVIQPEKEVRKPGFFSRQQVVTDSRGHVVATHYEQLVLNDVFEVQPRLLLTARNA